MGQAWPIWLLLALAVVAANLPFLSHRFLGLVSLRRTPSAKPIWMQVSELALLYFAVGGLGLWLEHRAGQIAPQRWEFYAITATLFVTLAFPGFVYRHLVKRGA
jgi:hypothetical protein